jgi:hypothetical protein
VVFAGSPRDRKPHFWLRVAALPVLPSLIAATLIVFRDLRLVPDGVAASMLLTLVFLTLPGLMLVPALLYRRPGSSPDASDDDGGGGPGRGPDPPPPPAPRGGVPLPDAEPARLRLREHGRRALGVRAPRRAPQEPVHSPHRAPSHR